MAQHLAFALARGLHRGVSFGEAETEDPKQGETPCDPPAKGLKGGGKGGVMVKEEASAARIPFLFRTPSSLRRND
jgi:hypothetical protein